MSTVKRSLILTFGTQYAELIIQFVGVMILARLMRPEEIGVYSVAAFLMAILHVFRDFGVAKYIIQEDDLSEDKIKSAFGVAIIMAWVIALILLSSSSLIANFYEKPEIKKILMVMSASFAITPLGSLLTAIFRRELQFKKIMMVRIGSAVCHTSVAVTLAIYGFGAISLAWANFAGILAFGLIASCLRSKHTPLVPHFDNIKQILSFGSISSIGTVAGVAGNNAPDVIIGKIINLAAAGYFSRANGLIQVFKTLVTGAILPLVLPYFAQLRRDNGDVIKPYHLAIENLTVFAWPFFAVLALLALPIVRTVYGMQWDFSVPVVQVLCLAGAISMLATFAGEVMIAYGHVRQVTLSQLIIQPFRIVAILLASPYGLVAVGIAITLAECVNVIICSYQLNKTNGVTLRGVLRATWKSVLVTIMSAAGPLVVVLSWQHRQHEAIELTLGGLAALAGWLLGIIVTHHPMRAHLKQAKDWLKKLRD